MTIQIHQSTNSQQPLSATDIFNQRLTGNMSIIGIVLGALIASYHLSFVQAIMVIILGASSFGLASWLSWLSFHTKLTTLNLSCATFGTKGNRLPTAIAWLSLIGWLAVNITTGSLLLQILLNELGLINNSVKIVSLILFISLIITSSLINESLLLKIQTIINLGLMVLTLGLLAFLLTRIDWQTIAQLPNGDWVTGVLAAISIIAAGSGFSWSLVAGDFNLDSQGNQSRRGFFITTSLNGFIPLCILMLIGVLAAINTPALATAANPFQVINMILPVWFTNIYFLIAILGLLPQCIATLKSAQINATTLGVDLSPKISLVSHGLIALILPIINLFVATNVLANLQLFLNLLGIFVAAWVVILFTDYLLMHHDYEQLVKLAQPEAPNYHAEGIIAWLVAVGLGILYTNNTLWTGVFAHAIFQGNSLGILVSMITGALMIGLFKIIPLKVG